MANKKQAIGDAKQFYEFANNIFDKICNIININKNDITPINLEDEK